MADQHQASYTIGKHWFVARTNIKCENRAELGLSACGYRTFCPKMTRWVTHARVRRVVERPLIARHLFVEIDPNKDGFGEVRSTDGVESLLGVAGTPVVVQSRFVEEFLRRQLQGEFDYAAREKLGNGCKVRIISGEYDDFFGVVQEHKARNGMVLVKVLETAILARMSVSNLRAA